MVLHPLLQSRSGQIGYALIAGQIVMGLAVFCMGQS